MNEQLGTGRRFVIAVATLAVAALALYLVVAKPYAAKGEPYTAAFGTAGQGLRASSPVKIRGMRVGSVSRVDVGVDGTATITFRLDRGVKLPDTTVASLEPESVFGPKFVNLLPGDHETTGPYLRSGARIIRTADPQDLGDLLRQADATAGALDAQDLSLTLNAMAEGLGGQGEDLRETLDDVGRLVEGAYDHRDEARRLAADLARLASIRGAGDDLAALASGTGRVIDTAASGNGRLRRVAAGASGLTRLITHGLDAHGGDLREGFRSAERVTGIVHAQLGLLGPMIRSSIGLVPYYRALTWMPTGVDGKHMLAGVTYLPTDPCKIIIGLCPEGGPRPTAKTAKTATRKTATGRAGQ